MSAGGGGAVTPAAAITPTASGALSAANAAVSFGPPAQQWAAPPAHPAPAMPAAAPPLASLSSASSIGAGAGADAYDAAAAVVRLGSLAELDIAALRLASANSADGAGGAAAARIAVAAGPEPVPAASAMSFEAAAQLHGADDGGDDDAWAAAAVLSDDELLLAAAGADAVGVVARDLPGGLLEGLEEAPLGPLLADAAPAAARDGSPRNKRGRVPCARPAAAAAAAAPLAGAQAAAGAAAPAPVKALNHLESRGRHAPRFRVLDGHDHPATAPTHHALPPEDDGAAVAGAVCGGFGPVVTTAGGGGGAAVAHAHAGRQPIWSAPGAYAAAALRAAQVAAGRVLRRSDSDSFKRAYAAAPWLDGGGPTSSG